MFKFDKRNIKKSLYFFCVINLLIAAFYANTFKRSLEEAWRLNSGYKDVYGQLKVRKNLIGKGDRFVTPITIEFIKNNRESVTLYGLSEYGHSRSIGYEELFHDFYKYNNLFVWVRFVSCDKDSVEKKCFIKIYDKYNVYFSEEKLKIEIDKYNDIAMSDFLIIFGMSCFLSLLVLGVKNG